MEIVAHKTTRIDVEHLGNQQVIACCLLEGDGQAALVDPGPASSLPTLLAKLEEHGLRVTDVTAILLTHIHLDHAGATGTLVQRHPRLKVFVHERGAVHMIRPARLLESAQRIYGDQMRYLWGEFLAVPEANIHALRGGERIAAGGRALDVEYTPGHASHHVSYFDSSTGLAFTGDTTGIRIANRPTLLPPTPPPDIDLELWSNSLELIARRKPAKFFLTHFGVAEPVDQHLAMMREQLQRWAERVRVSLENNLDDAARMQQFVRDVFDDLKHSLTEEEAERYMKGASPEMCWQGLARYWRKRTTAAT
jgi:glyoxylase-like metal-dependent hydrolase (beta-lactamase superfamily II)